MNGAHGSDCVVILDRDGTIVIDRGYLADPEGLEFLPGAPEALRWLWQRAYRLVVISNQSGVGRGLFSLARLDAMNARLHEMVEGAGAKLSRIYVCPHAPEAYCQCRKPNLALMAKAASELNFSPSSSVVIGDKESDIEFAHRAGAKSILVSSESLEGRETTAHLIVPNLMAAVRSITSSAPIFVEVPVLATRHLQP
jgi:D-glycero-D-manno-heptose 1,7-bisphosphate phosphatase